MNTIQKGDVILSEDQFKELENNDEVDLQKAYYATDSNYFLSKAPQEDYTEVEKIWK